MARPAAEQAGEVIIVEDLPAEPPADAPVYDEEDCYEDDYTWTKRRPRRRRKNPRLARMIFRTSLTTTRHTLDTKPTS